jgi:hypothetical protein
VPELPLGVEEWPGKAWLTYAARAATAATDPIAIPLVIERERCKAASRRRRAARFGSDRADRGWEACRTAPDEDIQSRVRPQADNTLKVG